MSFCAHKGSLKATSVRTLNLVYCLFDLMGPLRICFRQAFSASHMPNFSSGCVLRTTGIAYLQKLERACSSVRCLHCVCLLGCLTTWDNSFDELSGTTICTPSVSGLQFAATASLSPPQAVQVRSKMMGSSWDLASTQHRAHFPWGMGGFGSRIPSDPSKIPAARAVETGRRAEYRC